MALLQALNGQQSGRRFPLSESGAVLGRDPDCGVVVDATAVSRRHARIFCDRDTFFIEDLRNFVGDRPQADDMCLVCFGRVK